MIKSRKMVWARICGVVALLPFVGGCVAAIPAIMGATMIAERDRVSVRAATPLPASSSPSPASPVPDTAQYVLQPHLTELPPPSAHSDIWEPFVAHALAHKSAPLGGTLPPSAILAPITSVDQPGRRPCTAATPAVVVDLDEGPTTFAAGQAADPAPGLAQALSRLRAAGIVILWLSRAEASQVTQVAEALRASGLDPTGRDPLLLVRNDQDRKQVMRVEANEDVCIVAIAGDQRSDFDELFDYLLDPVWGDVLLASLEGNGWFLVPTPLRIR